VAGLAAVVVGLVLSGAVVFCTVLLLVELIASDCCGCGCSDETCGTNIAVGVGVGDDTTAGRCGDDGDGYDVNNGMEQQL